MRVPINRKPLNEPCAICIGELLPNRALQLRIWVSRTNSIHVCTWNTPILLIPLLSREDCENGLWQLKDNQKSNKPGVTKYTHRSVSWKNVTRLELLIQRLSALTNKLFIVYAPGVMFHTADVIQMHTVDASVWTHRIENYLETPNKAARYLECTCYGYWDEAFIRWINALSRLPDVCNKSITFYGSEIPKKVIEFWNLKSEGHCIV